MSDPATKQLSVPADQYDELVALAREEETTVEDLLFNLVLVYKSERYKQPARSQAARAALEECWRFQREHGIPEMTMEEINAEIAAARAETRELAKSA